MDYNNEMENEEINKSDDRTEQERINDFFAAITPANLNEVNQTQQQNAAQPNDNYYSTSEINNNTQNFSFPVQSSFNKINLKVHFY